MNKYMLKYILKCIRGVRQRIEIKLRKETHRQPPIGLLVYSALVQLSTRGSKYDLNMFYITTKQYIIVCRLCTHTHSGLSEKRTA